MRVWMLPIALVICLAGCNRKSPAPNSPPSPKQAVATGSSGEAEAVDDATTSDGPAETPHESAAVSSQQDPIDPESEMILDDGGEANVPNIVALLAHDNAAVRAEAARVLGYLDDFAAKTTPKLADALSDSSVLVRRRAAAALKNYELAALPALVDLIDAVDDVDDQVAADAITAVGNFGEAGAPAVDALIAVLTSDKLRERHRTAAETLGKIGEAATPAIPHLQEWIGEFIPEEVTIALGRLGDVESLMKLTESNVDNDRSAGASGLGAVFPTTDIIVARLASLLDDDDLYVRASAARALCHAHPTSDATLAALKKALQDARAEVRERAALGLSHLDPKTDAATQLVLEAVEHDDDSVRRYAASALSEFQGNAKQRLLALLTAAADDDPVLNSNAEFSITQSTDEFFPVLFDVLADREADERIRATATKLLGWMSNEDEERVQQVLTARLNDRTETVSVRATAAAIFNTLEIEHVDKFPALLEGLRSGSTIKVRELCAIHLGELRDPRGIDLLIESLASQDGDVAMHATTAVGRIGPPAAAAVPALCRFVEDEECMFRGQAAESLGVIGLRGELSVPLLLKVLDDESYHLREKAAGSLGSIVRESKIEATEVVTGLIRVLESDDEDPIRRAAIDSLAAIGEPAAPAVSHLTKAIADEDWQLRSKAILALAKIGEASRSAIPSIIKAVSDEEPAVRSDAVGALGDLQLEPDTVVPVLVEQLTTEGVEEESVEALAKFGEDAKAAIPDLLAFISSDRNYIKRGDAIKALAKIGPAAAQVKETFIQVMEDDDRYVRKAAASLWLKIADDDPDVVAAVVAGLADENLSFLFDQVSEDGLESLSGLLKSNDVEMRRSAVNWLREQRDPRCYSSLVEATNDEDAQVRQAAAFALYDLGAPDEVVLPHALEAFREAEEEWSDADAVLESIGRRAVPGLLEIARSPANDLVLRVRAVLFLGERHGYASAAIPGLEEMLQAKQLRLRKAAAVALGRIRPNDERTLPLILDAIKPPADPDRQVRLRVAAANTLGYQNQYSDQVLPALLSALSDHEQVAEAASYAFAQHKFTDESYALLAAALRDSTAQRFAFTACPVNRQLPESVVEALLPMLNHEEEYRRENVARVLSTAGPVAAERLVEFIQEGSPSAQATMSALYALGLTRPIIPGAKEVAERIYEANVPPIRAAAAVTLARLEDDRPEVMKDLIDALNNPQVMIGNGAKQALMQLGPRAKPVLPVLLEKLESSGPDDAAPILEVLPHIDSESAAVTMAMLEHAARHPEEWVANSVAYALREYSGASLASVQNALRSDRPELVRAAVSTLASFEEPHPEWTDDLEVLLANSDGELKLATAIAMSRICPTSEAALQVLVDNVTTKAESSADMTPIMYAVEALGRFSEVTEPAIVLLAEMIDDPAMSYQPIVALQQLSMKGTAEHSDLWKQVMPQLVTQLDDPQRSTWAASIIESVGESAASAAPKLMEKMNNSRNVWYVSRALGAIGPAGEAGIDRLEEMLDDPYDRYAAVSALAGFSKSGGRVVPLLVKLLDSDDAQLRVLAARALGRFEGSAQSAIPRLLQLVKEDEDQAVCGVSAMALGQLKADPERAVPAILSRMNDFTTSWERANLIRAVGAYGAEATSAVPALVDLLSEDDLHSSTCRALQSIGPAASDSVPALTRSLTDFRPDHRRNAAAALGAIGPKAASALEALGAVAQDPEFSVRVAAQDAIDAIKQE